jgi:hypothetical protein
MFVACWDVMRVAVLGQTWDACEQGQNFLRWLYHILFWVCSSTKFTLACADFPL